MSAGDGENDAVLDSPAIARRRREKRDDERGLVKAAQRGSDEAVEALIDRHWSSLYRAAYLIVHDAGVAEDIAQEAMLAAVDALHRFNRRRPLRPWLHRIAVNRALDHLRRPHRAREVSVDEVQAPGPPAEVDPGLSGEVMSALQSLGPEDRALVVLRHLWGYEPTEIAKWMGLPAATVRTRLHRALAKLRDELEPEGGTR